jgi:Holliday junction resolvase RusA-like endonuclease
MAKEIKIPPLIGQTIIGKVPSKSNLYRVANINGKTVMYKSKVLKQYEKSFYAQLEPQYRNLNINTYFDFYINVYYSTLRSDLDNSLKIVLDCLQASRVIKNDNKCMKIQAYKIINEKERIDFKIVTSKI